MNDGKQIEFWRGSFGNDYIQRNSLDQTSISQREDMWKAILSSLETKPASILEVGSNIGINLAALNNFSSSTLHALEPNENARDVIQSNGLIEKDNLYEGTASSIPLADNSVELSFTSGVLIHVSPDLLLQSCKEIFRVSSKYVVCIEYFSPTPEEIEYRGQEGLLFKRDFGGFWMDNFPSLHLVDYGFFWKRESGLDNLTWWAFEKR